MAKNSSSSSSSSSSSLKTTTTGRQRPVLFDNTYFDQFWTAYPRHEKKQDAAKAWKRLDPDEDLFKRIIKAVAEQKKSDGWKRGYVPHPTTWINGKRWEDELIPADREVGAEEVNSHIPSAADSKKMLEELMS
ncbi:hypothetical protein KW797_04995 [Candidatus Parcubacteria bacterium]|nr:hypothetical protein [Candidatus Parcubacteria bacterium]